MDRNTFVSSIAKQLEAAYGQLMTPGQRTALADAVARTEGGIAALEGAGSMGDLEVAGLANALVKADASLTRTPPTPAQIADYAVAAHAELFPDADTHMLRMNAFRAAVDQTPDERLAAIPSSYVPPKVVQEPAASSKPPAAMSDDELDALIQKRMGCDPATLTIAKLVEYRRALRAQTAPPPATPLAMQDAALGIDPDTLSPEARINRFREQQRAAQAK